MRRLEITFRMTDSESHIVDRYFREVTKTTPLSAEEEAVLARKIRLGDQAALEKLVTANLRFVISVAKKYQHQGLTFSDLISEGNAGLIKAAQRFDETKGFKFISYAVCWVRQSILLAIAEQSRTVRLPVNQLNKLSHITQVSALLEQKFGRSPALPEVASYMNAPEKMVRESLLSSGRAVSLDIPEHPGQPYSLVDVLSDPEDYADREITAEATNYQVRAMLSKLTARERTVIELSFGLCDQGVICPEDLAQRLAITTERVRQLKRSAISKLAAIATSGK